MHPWEYHPDLTAERLVKTVQLIARGRGNAVDRFDPSIGDDNWTLGVCAYNYGCFEIRCAAGSMGFDWLQVIDSSKHFQFSLGVVPLRFWRGDVQEPTAKISAPTPHEQFLLDYGPDVLTDGILFRINVAIDEDGALLDASFVAIRNNQPESIWPILLAGAEPLLVVIDETRPEGRELPPPDVGDHDDDEREQGDGTDPSPNGI